MHETIRQSFSTKVLCVENDHSFFKVKKKTIFSIKKNGAESRNPLKRPINPEGVNKRLSLNVGYFTDVNSQV